MDRELKKRAEKRENDRLMVLLFGMTPQEMSRDRKLMLVVDAAERPEAK